MPTASGITEVALNIKLCAVPYENRNNVYVTSHVFSHFTAPVLRFTVPFLGYVTLVLSNLGHTVYE